MNAFAFGRAFRRWGGVPPRDWRARRTMAGNRADPPTQILEALLPWNVQAATG
jgi:AraC-like DNA-binding protein